MNLKTNFIHKLFRLSFVSLFFVMVLAGCRSNDLFGDESENVSSIEVRDYDANELVTTITDSSFIDSLVRELEYANSSSTATINIPNPEYRLLFLNSEDNIIRDIGYYIEENDFGVVGRYYASGLYLAVITEIPIEESK